MTPAERQCLEDDLARAKRVLVQIKLKKRDGTALGMSVANQLEKDIARFIASAEKRLADG